MRVMAPRAGTTCALTTDARPVCWCNQMKRRQEKKRVLEGAKQAPPPPARSPEGARSPSKASPASSAPSAGTLQILQGGPSTWPREVVEHVQSLLALGWTSSKVVNHYSLQEFGLTPHQVRCLLWD